MTPGDHDVRVHRPGETAVCSQCGSTVRDRWVAMPHHEAGAVEVRVWCRACLLEAVGCPEEAARCRRADSPPDGKCRLCGGTGRTPSCANCAGDERLARYGGCNHFCWPCNGTGRA